MEALDGPRNRTVHVRSRARTVRGMDRGNTSLDSDFDNLSARFERFSNSWLSVVAQPFMSDGRDMLKGWPNLREPSRIPYVVQKKNPIKYSRERAEALRRCPRRFS